MKYELRKGACTAAVDTQGGELISFRDGAGTEYIWSGDPAYWSGRNPILFPIVGNLKNGRVRFGDREYEMPRHGFARRSEFTVAEQGDDFLVFELRESAATLEQYPFPFLLRVRHQLLEDGFSTAFEVQNTGASPLPFCIGAHTAFCCPLRRGYEFLDSRLVFYHVYAADSISQTPDGCLSHLEREPFLPHTNVIPLDHKVFDRLDTLTFDSLRSQGVSLLHRDSGRGLRVEFSGFPMVAFWTKPGTRAPYLCIEPWHGCAAYDNETGRFEDKPHCILLSPGQSKVLRYTVHIVSPARQ